MKDEHDKVTIDFVESQPDSRQAALAAARPAAGIPPPNNMGGKVPVRAASPKSRKSPQLLGSGANCNDSYGLGKKTTIPTSKEELTLVRDEHEQLAVRGLLEARYMPVSFVAKALRVTPRRVRALLSGGRLEGRVLENGYWEVLYPFKFVVGVRGPVLRMLQPKLEPVFQKKKRKRPLQWIHETKEQYEERIKSTI